MNRIYKIIRRALTGQTVVVSELTKGQSKSQSGFCSGMRQHHTHHSHLAPPQRIAISALLLTVFGSGALAQQLIYDGTGGTGILSFGATVTPSTNQNLSLDFKLNGYTGKREGVGASVMINYAF